MRKIFTASQEGILSAVSIISCTYIFSYGLSFIKQRFLIAAFGVDISLGNEKSLLGIFFLADKIPSLIFNAVVAGSLSVALIPAFTKKMASSGERAAWELASKVLNITLLVFAAFSILIFVFTNQIAAALSLSSSFDPILPQLIRVMMLSQFILIISVFETSALQSLKRFFVPSLAPIAYNFGIILFIVLFTNQLGIFAPAWGMVFGGLLHFAIQFPVLKKLNFRYRFSLVFDSEARRVFLMALPRTFGIIADQISAVIDTALAFFISPAASAILVLTLALQKLPSAIFGSSLAQVLLPRLSYLSHSDRNGFLNLVRSSSTKTLFFVLPCSVVLLVLRIPVIRLVYGVANFSWDSTIISSYTLAFFSLSVFAQSLIYILARAFYADNDTRTPFKAGVISIFVNIVLSILFVMVLDLGVWSLGLSYSVGVLINLVTLERFFKQKIGVFLTISVLEQSAKIFWSSLITGFCLYLPLKILDKYLFDTTHTINLLILTFVVSLIGIFSYYRISLVFNIQDAYFVQEKILIVKKRLLAIISR